MKKFVMLFALPFALQVASAQSLDSLFVNAPSEVLLMLDRNDRLDLLDYYNSKMEASVWNCLSGTSLLVEKCDSLIRLHTTQASELEIVWLRERGLILCLHTLQLPARQTFLDVFDEAWNRYPVKAVNLSVKDFFRGTDEDFTSEKLRNIVKNLTPIHYTMKWDFTRQEFTCTPSFDRVINEDRQIARQYFGKRIVRLDDITDK